MFCPMCGHENKFGEFLKKTEEYIDEFIEYNEDNKVDDSDDHCGEYKFDDFMIFGKITINKNIYSVIKLTDENDKELLYVSICVSDVDNNQSDDIKVCPFTLEKLVSFKNTMKDDLSTIGLWNDTHFGIFTILECS